MHLNLSAYSYWHSGIDQIHKQVPGGSHFSKQAKFSNTAVITLQLNSHLNYLGF